MNPTTSILSAQTVAFLTHNNAEYLFSPTSIHIKIHLLQQLIFYNKYCGIWYTTCYYLKYQICGLVIKYAFTAYIKKRNKLF